MLAVRNAVFLNVLMLAMPVALSRPASVQQPTRPEAKMAHTHAPAAIDHVRRAGPLSVRNRPPASSYLPTSAGRSSAVRSQ
jgi:hypothetical protein